jgi:hypothetical protein
LRESIRLAELNDSFLFPVLSTSYGYGNEFYVDNVLSGLFTNNELLYSYFLSSALKGLLNGFY